MSIGISKKVSIRVRWLLVKLYDLVRLKNEAVHSFDTKYKTDTSGIVRPEAMNIPIESMVHATRYQTASVDVYQEILGSLAIPHQEFLFVDLGSGKGRALLLAAHYPFKKIVGVELSEDLHKTACRNIEIYNDVEQQCRTIESVCSDVKKYEIPDGNIVFYLFNPFDAQILRAVLYRIEAAMEKMQRQIYVAYLKPVYRQVLDHSEYFQIEKEEESGKYVIYKNR